MKILLTSNGLKNPELERAFAHLTNNRTDLRVAIIHTASDPIDWVPEKEGSKQLIAKLVGGERLENKNKWLAEYAKTYTNKGNSIVFVDLKGDPKEIKEKLHNVDLIDVTGGDSNWLIDWAKVSGIGDYLKDLLDKGVVYYGSSAGCTLVIPEFGLTWWEPGMIEDRMSFGIVDFTVAPHQREDSEDRSTAHLIKRKEHFKSLGIDYPWRIYLVQDGQAVIVDGDKVEHIGPGIKKFI